MMKEELSKYSRTARIFHWISAAVIIWATLTGFFLATLAANSELRAFLSWFNVSLTTTFMPIFVLRMAYAAKSRKPALLDVPRTQQIAAKAAHILLYAVTGTVLASGLLMMQHDISLFGLASLPNPIGNTYWNNLYYGVHRYACMALFLLVLLHVAAVFRHHRAGRNILGRMV
jgi:cytochrome b561